jgi:hypothetical protein
MESLKKAIESNDLTAITRAMEGLTGAQHKAAESLYQQAAGSAGEGAHQGDDQPGASTGGAAGSGGRSGDVIDAEVVDEGKQ